MKKLAIVTTHPIQYYAPVFKLLQARQNMEVCVFYTWGQSSLIKHDPGFGKNIEWDIDLLSGYNYQWVTNTAANLGSHHFNGIVNPDLITQINEWQPDAVLVYGWSYHSHLAAMRYFKNKIPVFFRGDSTLIDNTRGLKSFLRSRYLKWVYKHIDIAFYVGLNNKAYFKKYGLKEKQLMFTPHAVDNERFDNKKPEETIALRASLKIKETDILILFAGKLEQKKNPDLLLNAFTALNKPDVHLLFVGNGELEQELKQQAFSHTNIHFIDFQNQTTMPVIYQACDLFCLPSAGPGETWGLAVNEAMACGKAILVSDKVGCAIDLVKNKQNGLIFKSKNAVSLLNAMKDLTVSKSQLAAYGTQSTVIIKEWNFMAIALSFEKALNNE